MSDQEENDEVVIHSTEVVGAASEEELAPKVRHYQRVTPLPTRVRDGSFEEEHLNAGGEEVPYSSIKYIAVAVIDQMVKKVTGGDDTDSPKERARVTREVFIMDVFTDVQDQPFRFAGGTVNYKSFLDKVGYVSHHNFFRFVVHFARRVPHAIATTSTAAFIAKRREKVARFNDFHDFELEMDQQIRFERDLIPVSDIDLSRDNWMEEWTLDDI